MVGKKTRLIHAKLSCYFSSIPSISNVVYNVASIYFHTKEEMSHYGNSSAKLV